MYLLQKKGSRCEISENISAFCLYAQVASLLLDYCTTDLDPTDPQAVDQLMNLRLCMLADGQLVSFTAGSRVHYYVLSAEEHTVLSGHPSSIVHWQVNIHAA